MASYFKKSSVISKSLRLAEISGMISKDSSEKTTVIQSVNHVICIDVSGSMYDEVGKMRLQLKSKLVDIVADGDTVTLIWFNHKCGIISEMVHLDKADDLRDMNKAIDKYLKASGWTNFRDPIQVTNELIDRMSKVDGLWNFIFLSDGGHNDCPWSDVVSEMDKLSPKISSAAIIEYGYYADTNRLTEMAETLGGQKIFEKDFEGYEVDFDKLITDRSSRVEREEIDITDFKSSMKLQLMFTVDEVDKSIKVYDTNRRSTILIPKDTERLYFIENIRKTDKVANKSELDDNNILYAVIYILADRLKYNLAEEVLYASRDKELIEEYTNSFGKQKLEKFKNDVLDRLYGVTKASEFTTSSYKPNPKKYCVMDFIDDITSSDDNEIMIFHPDFNYTRTTAKAVAKVELTEEEKERLSGASTKLTVEKVLRDASENQVKMEISNPNKGYSVKNLVWNNERANLSFQVTIDVKLTFPMNAPIKTFDSFITRNYTIIKDGILNISTLPIRIPDSTLRGKFKRMKLVKNIDGDILTLDISSLPILNKKRTESVYAYMLADNEVKLLECKCYNKYLAYLKKSDKYKEMSNTGANNIKAYNTEISDYLASVGVTDRGYNAKTELDYSGDYYMALCLSTKIKGFSSLPKIEDVLERIKSGKKMTAAGSLMKKCMENVDTALSISNNEYGVLTDLISNYKAESARLLKMIAMSKFNLIISRKWFADRTNYDDNEVEVKINGESTPITFSFTEKKINL